MLKESGQCFTPNPWPLLTQQLAAQDLQTCLHGIMWSGSSSTVLMVLCRSQKREKIKLCSQKSKSHSGHDRLRRSVSMSEQVWVKTFLNCAKSESNQNILKNQMLSAKSSGEATEMLSGNPDGCSFSDSEEALCSKSSNSLVQLKRRHMWKCTSLWKKYLSNTRYSKRKHK